MDYNSVAEIFDDIDATRARLFRSVEGLSAAEQVFRPAPEKWSAAEVMEHLALVERRVARLIASLLEKAEAAGPARVSDEPFAPVSIAEFVEQTRAQKLEAPDSARPAGAPLDASLSALRDSRSALRALRPRVERADCASARFPHPVWGPLNLYQWLLFLGAHDARHLAQIEALKEASSAQRRAPN
jgi:DinB superfamily